MGGGLGGCYDTASRASAHLDSTEAAHKTALCPTNLTNPARPDLHLCSYQLQPANNLPRHNYFFDSRICYCCGELLHLHKKWEFSAELADVHTLRTGSGEHTDIYDSRVYN